MESSWKVPVHEPCKSHLVFALILLEEFERQLVCVNSVGPAHLQHFLRHHS